MKSRWEAGVAHESRYFGWWGGRVMIGVMVVVVVEVISCSEERCFSVMKGECLGGGFWLVGGGIFDFGGCFAVVVVEMEVYDLELEVGAIVRLVWICVNGELGAVLFVVFDLNVFGRENV